MRIQTFVSTVAARMPVVLNASGRRHGRGRCSARWSSRQVPEPYDRRGCDCVTRRCRPPGATPARRMSPLPNDSRCAVGRQRPRWVLKTRCALSARSSALTSTRSSHGPCRCCRKWFRMLVCLDHALARFSRRSRSRETLAIGSTARVVRITEALSPMRCVLLPAPASRIVATPVRAVSRGPFLAGRTRGTTGADAVEWSSQPPLGAAHGARRMGPVMTSMTIKTAAAGSVDTLMETTTRRRSCRRW
jgi:hypothetical protein